jgi:ribose transport system permease protein
VWILVIAVFGLLKPESFLTSGNFSTIFGSQAVLVVLTLGLIIPMTTGDFDLSIAFNLTLCSMVIAVLNVNHHVPIGFAILLALLVGAAVGLLNGLIITFFAIDAIIVTLGVGTLLGGVTLWISDSTTISGVSQSLVKPVILDRLFGVPLEFYYGLAACVVLWYVFEYTPLGRRLLIVGRGRNVARLSGLRVQRIRIGALVASGLGGALAGVLYTGTSGAADPTSGADLLLPAFAAAFLGATAIMPGRFNPWGSIIAVYFLVTGITGLQILGVASFVQELFYGGALVIAVCLSQLARKRQELTAGAG